jgi:hypothetical protein
MHKKKIIYDAKKRIDSLNDKASKAEIVYNEIQIEIEKRICEKLDLEGFAYNEILETQLEVRELLEKNAK